MAYCEKCKYENVCEMPAFIRNDVKRCRVFEERKPQKPQTNADRIRSMSDEELAEFLEGFEACSYCEYMDGTLCTFNNPCVHGFAAAMIQKWLQSEAE